MFKCKIHAQKTSSNHFWWVCTKIVCPTPKKTTVDLPIIGCVLQAGNGRNECELILQHNIYIVTKTLWSGREGGIGADCWLVISRAKVWWVVMFIIAKLVFAPGPGEVEWSWTHANKCFCSAWTKPLPSFGLTLKHCCHCFLSIASCHSSCQSLIRTTSFRRHISHFTNFLTLPNEAAETHGRSQSHWQEGMGWREGKGKVRGGAGGGTNGEIRFRNGTDTRIRKETGWAFPFYLNSIAHHWKQKYT